VAQLRGEHPPLLPRAFQDAVRDVGAGGILCVHVAVDRATTVTTVRMRSAVSVTARSTLTSPGGNWSL
jgi:hypothetical protein